MSVILRTLGIRQNQNSIHWANIEPKASQVALAAVFILGVSFSSILALAPALSAWGKLAGFTLITAAFITLYKFTLQSRPSTAQLGTVIPGTPPPRPLSLPPLRQTLEFTEIPFEELQSLPKMRQEPENPFRFKEAEIAHWLENPSENLICNGRPRPLLPAEHLMLQSRQLITLQQLKSALFACAQKLNERLPKEPYAMCATPQKSSAWVGEYVVENFMEARPAAHFTHTDGHSKQNGAASKAENSIASVRHDIKHFVLCDDVAYSGAQLLHLIQEISQGTGVFGRDLCHLYILCPFLSPNAKKRLNREARFHHQLQVHIISTNFEIMTREKIFAGKLHLFRQISQDGLQTTSLITEWKVPDNVSTAACFGKKGFSLGDDTVYAVTPEPTTLPVYKGEGAPYSFLK